MWIKVKNLFFIAVDFRGVVQGKWGWIMEPGKVRILQQVFISFRVWEFVILMKYRNSFSTGIFLRTFHIPIGDAAIWPVTKVQSIRVSFSLSVSLSVCPSVCLSFSQIYPTLSITAPSSLPSLLHFVFSIVLGYDSSFLTASKISATQ